VPPSTPPATRSQRNGYSLAGALYSLIVLSLGLIPLASLAPAGLGWLREHNALAHATRLAEERAELDLPAGAPGRDPAR